MAITAEELWDNTRRCPLCQEIIFVTLDPKPSDVAEYDQKLALHNEAKHKNTDQ